jgi:hypothetical protein
VQRGPRTALYVGSSSIDGRRCLRQRARREVDRDPQDKTLRALLSRLSGRHPSGGTVIERAAIVAEGDDSAAVVPWILDHASERLKRSTAPGSPKRLPPTRPVPSSGGVPSATGEAQGLHCLLAWMGVRPQWRAAFASAASCCHAQRRRLGRCPRSRPRPGKVAVSRTRHDVRPRLLARDRSRHDATPLAMPVVLPRESAAFPWKRSLVSRPDTPASDCDESGPPR